jgi:hypothetical protein
VTGDIVLSLGRDVEQSLRHEVASGRGSRRLGPDVQDPTSRWHFPPVYRAHRGLALAGARCGWQDRLIVGKASGSAPGPPRSRDASMNGGLWLVPHGD